MNKLYTVLIVGLLFAVVCEAKTVTVSSSKCGNTYTIDEDESLYLNYNGRYLGTSACKITVELKNTADEICSDAEKFSVSDCDLELEYHDGYMSSFADATYGCSAKQYSDHCTLYSNKLIVVFRNDKYSSVNAEIDLRIYARGNAIVDAVVTSVYVIIGVVVGIIVLVIIITIIVICVCCRRRQSRAGTVFGNQQPAVMTTTTGGYPMQNQAGYQPGQPLIQPQGQQTGYQPGYPQTGFQQQPMGYQPGFQPSQPGGYPPAPQQGYAGFQTGGDPYVNEKASAPPMQPPPYPGN